MGEDRGTPVSPVPFQHGDSWAGRGPGPSESPDPKPQHSVGGHLEDHGSLGTPLCPGRPAFSGQRSCFALQLSLLFPPRLQLDRIPRRPCASQAPSLLQETEGPSSPVDSYPVLPGTLLPLLVEAPGCTSQVEVGVRGRSVGPTLS